MGLKQTLFLLVAALLGCGHCLDWQGSGNWTQDNLTTIRSKIFALSPSASSSTYLTFSQNLSRDLNQLWDPAWNVVIAYFAASNKYDAVVYGYPFNGHWFWFNGFKVDSGYVTFIIWKDYNCVQWISFNPNSFTGITSNIPSNIKNSLNNRIYATMESRDLNDIWNVAKDLQAIVPSGSSSLFADKLAYTIIATQSTSAQFYGKFCVKYYLQTTIVGVFPNAEPNSRQGGKSIILQMRQPTAR